MGKQPQFPRFSGTQHQPVRPEGNLVLVSVGCGVNDVETSQNGVPVWFKEDVTRADADQRRRNPAGPKATAFRQAFNPLQRQLICSPKPSLQNKPSHRRHWRSIGTSPKTLAVTMSGVAPAEMALLAIKSVPLTGGFAKATVIPVLKACLRFLRPGLTHLPAPFG